MGENKVTQRTVNYPNGSEPNFILPEEYQPYRFALGKLGKNPLVAICMNPSATSEYSRFFKSLTFGVHYKKRK
ncbi:hypothetical protein [Mycoplasma sp. P36-A1]|uniref:hypothetical protein n=1 Tax=Mycoplasma sp. P36-A1 TaxID=3252900 RepID=UPI003C2F39EC